MGTNQYMVRSKLGASNKEELTQQDKQFLLEEDKFKYEIIRDAGRFLEKFGIFCPDKISAKT